MSTTTTEATPPPPDVARPSGSGGPAGPAGVSDPYLRGTDETVLLECPLYTSDAADDLLCGDLGGIPFI